MIVNIFQDLLDCDWERQIYYLFLLLGIHNLSIQLHCEAQLSGVNYCLSNLEFEVCFKFK